MDRSPMPSWVRHQLDYASRYIDLDLSDTALPLPDYGYSEVESDQDSSDEEDDSDDDDSSSFTDDPLPFLSCYDPVGRRDPFCLPQDADPTKPVYEGWTIYIPEDEKDEGQIHVAPTSHSQEELASIHLAALDKYHGTYRGGGGCLPLRRFMRCASSRATYDEHMDSSIRKRSRVFQDELTCLMKDRARHSSTINRDRDWTVAVMQEQLCHRFASLRPTPARRHRVRWWKDNTRGRETEVFVIILGRETRHEPGGISMYGRYTNPWRAIDLKQFVERRKAMEKEGSRGSFTAPDRSRGRIGGMSIPRRPGFSQYEYPSRPVPSGPDSAQTRRFSTMRPRSPPNPFTPRPVPHDFEAPLSFPLYQGISPPFSGVRRPPPPPPGPPPTYRAVPYSPDASPSRQGTGFFPNPPPPLAGSGFYGPPLPRTTPPPHSSSPRHFSNFFASSGSSFPSASWPPSPSSYRPVPPPPGLCSNLTTPTSLSSIHVPMFGPIPPPPPVAGHAVPRSPSPPYSPRTDEKRELADEKMEEVVDPEPPIPGGGAPQSRTSTGVARHAYCEDEEEGEGKSLAKEKPPGMNNM